MVKVTEITPLSVLALDVEMTCISLPHITLLLQDCLSVLHACKGAQVFEIK